MIHAYDKKYLDDAMRCLGEAFDYAKNTCNMEMDVFLGLFVSSGCASKFEIGVPKYVSGISGIELAIDVFCKSGLEMRLMEQPFVYDYSSEYWCGWILSYYQWLTGKSFKEIHKFISMNELNKLYSILHEVSEQKAIEIINKTIKNKRKVTRLQVQRKISGYSQRQLAEKVGISLRTLQQYEIKAKDINRAAASTLVSISKVLGCRVEDLLEYDI